MYCYWHWYSIIYRLSTLVHIQSMVDNQVPSQEYMYWQNGALLDQSLGSVKGKLLRFNVTQSWSVAKTDFWKACDDILAKGLFRFASVDNSHVSGELRACITKHIIALKHLHTAIYGSKEDAMFFSILDDVFGAAQADGKHLLGEQLWYQLLYYVTLISYSGDC